jgi:acetyl-CoA carboxylase biotin carboxylase subunit
MFQRILVANRGEIARRIFRTARRLGIGTVAIHSSVEAEAAHVVEADCAVGIASDIPARAYLQAEAIIAAARSTGAEAIHPGYGFLSENADFAEAVGDAGLVWIGPSPESIRALGDKAQARARMCAAGFPVGRGGMVADAAAALALANEIGAPVMVKASAGGGGIGMQIVQDLARLPAVLEQVSAQANRFFGHDGLIVERYMGQARHIELQAMGLADGTVHIIGERDCSVQRRFQKVVEEAPAANLSPQLRERMYRAAAHALGQIGYRNLGTVECLVDGDAFIFLEVNTRLQVEHPVTEMVNGIDLVEAQLRIAAADAPGFDPQGMAPSGHAIELRVYAEDPVRFLPGGGPITTWQEPVGPGIRIDSGYRAGDTVTSHFDPLMAKLCLWGETRAIAIARARAAVDGFVITGPKNNLPFLGRILADPTFIVGAYDTTIVARLQSESKAA